MRAGKIEFSCFNLLKKYKKVAKNVEDIDFVFDLLFSYQSRMDIFLLRFLDKHLWLRRYTQNF